MKWEQQNPLEMATHVARHISGYPGPWSPAEAVSLDIDKLGAPYIDDANPNTAGKLGLSSLLRLPSLHFVTGSRNDPCHLGFAGIRRQFFYLIEYLAHGCREPAGCPQNVKQESGPLFGRSRLPYPTRFPQIGQ